MKMKNFIFKKERFCLLMLGLLFATVGFAQNITVKGAVGDTNNKSVIGANVVEKETANNVWAEYVYAVGGFQTPIKWDIPNGYPLVCLYDDGIYGGFIYFPEGELGYLILPNKNSTWEDKYGSDGNGGLLQGGSAGDIFVTEAGWHWIEVDLKDLRIKRADLYGDKVGVAGDFNNWGLDNPPIPDIPMTYNYAKHRFEATITFASAGYIKFRMDESFSDNKEWGGSNGGVVAGGGNIGIGAGTYLVTLDLITMVYSVEPIDPAPSTFTTIPLARGRNWYLSSPVSGAKVKTVFADAAFVEYYNEPSRSPTDDGWVNIRGIEDISDPVLTPGKGYVVWANEDGTGSVSYTFTGGAPNTEDVTVGLTRTSGVDKEGFNLVGNPYSLHIDWNLVSAANSTVEPTIWYRTKNGSYEFHTYNGTSGMSEPNDPKLRYIPPMQGFWVRALSANDLEFTPDVIANGATSTLKSSSPDTRPLIRLQLADDAKTDRVVIFADENAKDGFDRYDSEKMFNTGAALYTKVSGEKLIFNGLSDITEGLEIPLGFVTDHSGMYGISAIEVQNLDDLQPILKDNVSNTEFDLSNGEAYRFTSDAMDNTSRFIVVFRSKEVGNMPNPVKDEVSVYTRNNTLYVKSPVPVKQVQVYDLSGRLLYDTKECIIYNVAPGIRIVKVETANSTVNRKVTVQ
jgi:hypothetical protein